MTDSRHLTAIGASYLASLAVYSQLPGPYLDDLPITLARPLIAFGLPTTAAVTYALLGRLWARDPVRGTDLTGEATYKAILLWILLFLVALHVLVLAVLTGALWAVSGRAWAPRIVVALFGLALVAIGNLLPRTRPNVVIGIRTSRTLTDRRLWMEMHRVAGYVAVGLGVTIALAGVVLPGPKIPVAIQTAGAIGIAVLGVQYWKQRRAHTEIHV